MGDSVALYRKYRGRKLADIIGQDHITKPLANALKAGRISHAYLLTGPHGVGKTSVARILAHEINGLPYEENSEHLDIIEIDAASNRRIDEIRDLREKVHVSPTSAKYKVYIIDEVHMLTREAFNALLKTLEEPPKHVVFILATTEAHKLPETIISRTQRHTFKPITQDAAKEHLRTIADKEKVKINDDALQLLVEHGRGSFRDSISLLDQMTSSDAKEITTDDVESMLGLASATIISSLLEATQSSDIAKVIDLLDKTHEAGINPPTIAQQIIRTLRTNQRLQGATNEANLNFIDQLLSVGTSLRADIKLETVLLRQAHTSGAPAQTTPAKQPQTSPKFEATKSAPQKVKKVSPSQNQAEAPTPPPTPIEDVTVGPTEKGEDLSDDTWQGILTAVKARNNSLHAVIRMAQASANDDTLILSFRFPFHKKQASESKNSTIIQEVASDILSRKVVLQCVVDATVGEPKEAKNILDTFGGGEVLSNG